MPRQAGVDAPVSPKVRNLLAAEIGTQAAERHIGQVFFDGSHQLGWVGAGFFQDPVAEGPAVLTGAAGKIFGGRQYR
jgi:glycine/serine hydroxymethyltransferase